MCVFLVSRSTRTYSWMLNGGKKTYQTTRSYCQNLLLWHAVYISVVLPCPIASSSTDDPYLCGCRVTVRAVKFFASLSNSHLSPAGSVRCGRHFFIRSHLKVTLVSAFNYVRFQSALFCRSVSLCPSSKVCYKRSTLTFFLSRLFDSLS